MLNHTTKIWVLISVFLFSWCADAYQTRTREAVAKLMKPLADQLLPDDQIVIFGRISGPPLLAVPDRPGTPLENLQDLSLFTSYAAVVQVEGVEGMLIDSGTWIETAVNARVLDAVMSRLPRSLEPGNRVAFFQAGGQVKIKGVEVRTKDMQPLEIGKEYLVLLAEDGLRLYLYLDYELGPQRTLLRRTPDGKDHPVPFTADQAIAAIKEAAKRRP